MSDTKHVDTMDLRAALAGGCQEMDGYLELRNGDQIIAEIKALVETGTGERSLRDYFAGQALAGLCANPGGPFQSNGMTGWGIVNCTEHDIALRCMDIADAMLKARER